MTSRDEVEGREAFRRFKRLTKAVLAVSNLEQIPEQQQEHPKKEDNLVPRQTQAKDD